MSSKVQDSVALITSDDPDNISFGTGFAIYRNDKYTYLLTCAHVIRDIGGAEKILVDQVAAELVASGSDDGLDLAVLQVEDLHDVPPLKLRSSGDRGMSFVVTGFGVFEKPAERFARRPLRGKLGEQISFVSRKRPEEVTAWDLNIEDDFFLKSGYSGSPVVDEEGYVFAVASHSQNDGKKGYAISIEGLAKIWPEMPADLLRGLSYVQAPHTTKLMNPPASHTKASPRLDHIVIFMITPFAKEYERIIRAVRLFFERPPYCFEVRLDSDYTHSTRLLENIRQNMQEAHGYIAEISTLNPNVMFELGAVMLFNDNQPIFLLRNRDASENIPADIREKLYISYSSLNDPLDKLVADIRSAFERDGRIVNRAMEALLAQRKKRFLSRTLLEGLRISLEESNIAGLRQHYPTIEDLLMASPADVAQSANLPDYLIGAIQGELKAY